MREPPKVSVILATCRRIPCALDCIASVLRNSYTGFELIVVDQDPEQTLRREVERRFPDDGRIVYVFVDAQMLSRARNAGMAAASGDIFVFVDDDAVVGQNWLASYVEVFRSVEPPPGAVAGCLRPIWETPVPRWLPEEKWYLLGLYDKVPQRCPMPEGDLPVGANFAVLRCAAEAAGPFNEELGFSYARKAGMLAGEDSLFALQIRKRGYSLYYEPRAEAQHKISAGKLRLSYFVRRNFWEGATLLTTLYLTGSISRASCAGIIRHHLKFISYTVFRTCVRQYAGESRLPCLKKLARGLADCSSSAGVIYWALRLWKIGRVP